MLEIEVLKSIWLCFGLILRIDQLQLLSRQLHDRGCGFRADTDPVNTLRRDQRTVRFNGDLKTKSSGSGTLSEAVFEVARFGPLNLDEIVLR